VNLERFDESGFTNLRPLMMAFESDDFMLPIQLGTVNADGPQDLTIYLLSPEGRVELENYRVANIPSDVYLPEFVENEFAETYKAIFDTAHEREGGKAVMLEYAWDRAGVFWNVNDFNAPNVYLTRLHVRYTKETFPEDLMFRVTQNRENFQGRYILQRPFRGELTCEEGREYLLTVADRQEQEAQTLANLTGWDYSEIMAKIEPLRSEVNPPSWWERVFEAIGQ
jgi:hypothetical protein